MTEYLPVVYVRGFAGPTASINQQVDDPFYGFNAGATHVRVDGDGDPRFFQFEGPLLRLMVDEDYKLLVRGGQRAYLESRPDGNLPQRSLWVYRFYDAAATTYAPPRRRSLVDRVTDRFDDAVGDPAFDIEEAARGLYDFIELIRRKTGARAVYVVAHSMGGLVARCMIQKVCEEATEDGAARSRAKDIVAKLFTYGTPHGGIDFDLSALDWAMEAFGPAGSDIFAADLMYGYLTPHATWGSTAPDDEPWDPQVIPEDVFPGDRVFCLVGTNPADYGASRLVVGPKSDGLVKIDHAYVRNAHRAFVHRSHSGRYGEVNSEEGYQSLRRFLFGAYSVRVDLDGVTELGRDDTIWQADVRLTVRGLPVVLHEQASAHHCPVQINEELLRIQRRRELARERATAGEQPEHAQQDADSADSADSPVPLTTVFLLDPSRSDPLVTDEDRPRARYTVALRLLHLRKVRGGFGWRDHLEQVPDWSDVLIVDVGRGDEDPVGTLKAWAAWNSTVPGANDRYDPITKLPGGDRGEVRFAADATGQLVATVDLPHVAQEILGEGSRLVLTVTDRRGAPVDLTVRDVTTGDRQAARP